MLALSFLFASFLVPVIAAPAPINIGLGIEFGPGSNDLPTLKLPYATYKAYSYDVTDDVSFLLCYSDEKYLMKI
jgi:hypothetical protein